MHRNAGMPWTVQGALLLLQAAESRAYMCFPTPHVVYFKTASTAPAVPPQLPA
jgi:hypothetical protein